MVRTLTFSHSMSLLSWLFGFFNLIRLHVELFCFLLKVTGIGFCLHTEYAHPEQTYKYEVDDLVEMHIMLRWAENHNILDRVGSVFR